MSFFSRNKFLTIGLLLVAVGICFLIASHVIAEREKPVVVPQEEMTFEIADTQAKQERGLSGRAHIPDNWGMLFVLPTESAPGFWMKDMLVPIDIIWLSKDGTIVSINHSVSPDTYPQSFYPLRPVSFVLETRAGYAKEHGWELGTHIDLPKI